MSAGKLGDKLFCYAGARRRLSAYLDQELCGPDRARVENHVKACRHCHKTCQQLLFAKRAAAHISPPDQQPVSLPRLLSDPTPLSIRRLSQAPRFNWIQVTAAVVLVVVMFGVWIGRQSRSPAPTPSIEVVRLSGAPAINRQRVGISNEMRKGDWLETDEGSTALLKFGRLGQIEAESGTRLDLLETNSGAQHLSLMHGKIYASI